MKFFTLFISFLTLLCYFATSAHADVQFSPQTKIFEQDLQDHLQDPRAKKIDLPESFVQDYALRPADSTYWGGAALKVNEEEVNVADFEEKGLKIGSKINDIWTVRFPVELFFELREIEGLNFVEMAASYGPELDKANEFSNVNPVHQGVQELESAYSGEDVIMAVIDWGYDYTHPQFYDEEGEEHRIKAVWDQNNVDFHKPPLKFNYGAFFTDQEMMLDQERDADYLDMPYSHGNHVAGIAGGSGGGTEYKGVAPESDLILVSLRRDAPSLIDAFHLIDELAEQAGKPYVVNMSFGGHYGPHDGTDLQNQAIEKLSDNGKLFVSSAGNNGNDPLHLTRNLAEEDTLKTFVEFGDSNHQAISMWNDVGEQFKTRAKVYDSRGRDLLYKTPFVSTADDPHQDIVFTPEGQDEEVLVRFSGQAESHLNDKPNKRMEIKKERFSRIALEIVAEDGQFHMWNCQMMPGRYSNNCFPFENSVGPNVREDFTAGDTTYTVGEPGGTGKKVITVGAYTTKNQFENKDGNFHPADSTALGPLQDLAFFSSVGPTADGRLKPEITGPGNLVVSSSSSFDPDIRQSAIAEEVEFEGRTYPYDGKSGTSMSGPMVAGVVALMLEANPDLDYYAALDILRETAIRDSFTGDLDYKGNNTWGAGKVNALEAVQMAESYEVEERPSPDEEDIAHFSVFPNPTLDRFSLLIKEQVLENVNEEVLTYDLVNNLGQSKKSGEWEVPEEGNLRAEANLEGLPSGIYHLHVDLDNDERLFKVIKR